MTPNTGSILAWMGYTADVDFIQIGNWDSINWLIPEHPTDAEIEQQELPWLRWQRKTDARRDIETYIDGAIRPVTRSMLRDGEPVIDAATGEAVREFIADCYSAVNDFDDAVDLTDLETINTVAVDLPAYEGPQQ